ncbi:MAG: tRNA (guanosine(37)-N1)-methyltransferase TrmD [Fimbriimonadaceae bacterium]|nr:tRNA (guanosine(37)-N1)-methyltransferase TrmD [Fimbriimonadaceae bacterium]
MRLGFVSLFPDLIEPYFAAGVLGRAARKGLLEIVTANPRDFAYDRHRTVDDSPCGGGPGMLMRVEPVDLALRSLRLSSGAAVVVTEPFGSPFDQAVALELAERPEVAFVCGHYEGIDARFARLRATHVLSVGDFVLTGGELPALVMADAVARLVPGVLGSPESAGADSFAHGLLSAPNYTRPVEYEGIRVPDVLLSGDHRAIEEWRRAEALRITRENRPDLFARAALAKKDADRLSS